MLKTFPPIIKIISTILIIAFLAQDIVWAYPDSTTSQKYKLATQSFFKSEESVGKAYLEFIGRLIAESQFRLGEITNLVDAIDTSKMQEEDRVCIKTIIPQFINRIGGKLSLIRSEAEEGIKGEGKITLEARRVNIKDVIGSVLERMQPEIKSRKKNISVKGDAAINTDPERLQSILKNLINNAIKYTGNQESYGGKIWVKVEQETSGKAKITVTDNGIGIEGSDLERIFDRGFMVDSDRIAKNIPRSGEGLYFTKKNTILLGGQIWADSEGLGRGSKFIVELPPSHDVKSIDLNDAVNDYIHDARSNLTVIDLTVRTIENSGIEFSDKEMAAFAKIKDIHEEIIVNLESLQTFIGEASVQFENHGTMRRSSSGIRKHETGPDQLLLGFDDPQIPAIFTKTADGAVSHPFIKPGSLKARSYELELAQKASSENSIIIMPTGLGKTYVAAMSMAEHLLVKPGAKILFMAPTRELAKQHKETLGSVLRTEKIALITEHDQGKDRNEMWQNSDVIITTYNLVASEITKRISAFDLSKITYLVVDEAHHTTKDHAASAVTKEYLRIRGHQVYTLGLTASPGHDIDTIEEVRKNMGVKYSGMLIRKNGDPDIKPYIHWSETSLINVKRDKLTIEVSDVIKDVYLDALVELEKYGLLSKVSAERKHPAAQQPIAGLRREDALSRVDRDRVKDIAKNLYEFSFEAMGKVIQKWISNAAPYSEARGNYFRLLSVCKKAEILRYLYRLADTHGIYEVDRFFARKEEDGQTDKKLIKACRSILEDPRIQRLREQIGHLIAKGAHHPKIAALTNLMEENKGKKTIVFAENRSSVENIVMQLNGAGIKGARAEYLIGKAGKGHMTAKEQGKILKRFRDSEFNVLAATQIGEEGLDIPGVDLVIFYEPVSDERRLVQRAGRQGRSKDGKIYMLITDDTWEARTYYSALKKRRQMEQIIADYQKLAEQTPGAPRQSSSGSSRYPGFTGTRLRESTVEELLKLIDIQRGDRVIDVGIGGEIASRLIAEKAGPRQEAISISEEALISANDLRKISTEGADKVIVFDSIHLTEEKEALLDNAWILLKPGGTFAFCTSYFKGSQSEKANKAFSKFYVRILKRLKEKYPNERLQREEAPWRRQLSEQEYLALFDESGFIVTAKNRVTHQMTPETMRSFLLDEGVLAGLLPGVSPQAASEVLNESLGELLKDLNGDTLERDWLYVVAKKESQEAHLWLPTLVPARHITDETVKQIMSRDKDVFELIKNVFETTASAYGMAINDFTFDETVSGSVTMDENRNVRINPHFVMLISRLAHLSLRPEGKIIIKDAENGKESDLVSSIVYSTVLREIHGHFIDWRDSGGKRHLLFSSQEMYSQDKRGINYLDINLAAILFYWIAILGDKDVNQAMKIMNDLSISPIFEYLRGEKTEKIKSMMRDIYQQWNTKEYKTDNLTMNIPVSMHRPLKAIYSSQGSSGNMLSALLISPLAGTYAQYIIGLIGMAAAAYILFHCISIFMASRIIKDKDIDTGRRMENINYLRRSVIALGPVNIITRWFVRDLFMSILAAGNGESDRMKAAAARALGANEGRRAVPALIKIIDEYKNNPFYQELPRAAIGMLGEIDSSEVMDYLVSLLTEPTAEIEKNNPGLILSILQALVNQAEALSGHKQVMGALNAAELMRMGKAYSNSSHDEIRKKAEKLLKFSIKILLKNGSSDAEPARILIEKITSAQFPIDYDTLWALKSRVDSIPELRAEIEDRLIATLNIRPEPGSGEEGLDIVITKQKAALRILKAVESKSEEVYHSLRELISFYDTMEGIEAYYLASEARKIEGLFLGKPEQGQGQTVGAPRNLLEAMEQKFAGRSEAQKRNSASGTEEQAQLRLPYHLTPESIIEAAKAREKPYSNVVLTLMEYAAAVAYLESKGKVFAIGTALDEDRKKEIRGILIGYLRKPPEEFLNLMAKRFFGEETLYFRADSKPYFKEEAEEMADEIIEFVENYQLARAEGKGEVEALNEQIKVLIGNENRLDGYMHEIKNCLYMMLGPAEALHSAPHKEGINLLAQLSRNANLDEKYVNDAVNECVELSNKLVSLLDRYAGRIKEESMSLAVRRQDFKLLLAAFPVYFDKVSAIFERIDAVPKNRVLLLRQGYAGADDALRHQFNIARVFINRLREECGESVPEEEGLSEIQVIALGKLVRAEAKYFMDVESNVTVDVQGVHPQIMINASGSSVTGLLQIVRNLIVNAIQAMPKDREKGLVKCSLERDGDKIILKISDNGKGMNAAELGEAEQRLTGKVTSDRWTTKPGGSGVGLIAIGSAAIKFGGKASVTSQEGIGSTFVVELPETITAEDVQEPSEDRRSSFAKRQSSSGMASEDKSSSGAEESLEKLLAKDMAVSLANLKQTMSNNDISSPKALILYADSMLEQAAVMDLEDAMSKSALFNNSTIILYGHKDENASILEKMIRKANSAINIIVVRPEELLERYSTEYNEVKELDALIRLARAKGINNGTLLGVVKGRTDEVYLDKIEDISKEQKLPIISFESEGIYSFSQIISAIIEAKRNNSWFIRLPPLRKITEDIRKAYEDYIMSLRELQTKA